MSIWVNLDNVPTLDINENSEHCIPYEIGYAEGKRSKCEGCCQYDIGYTDGITYILNKISKKLEENKKKAIDKED